MNKYCSQKKNESKNIAFQYSYFNVPITNEIAVPNLFSRATDLTH